MNKQTEPIRHGAIGVIRRAEQFLVIRRSQTVAAPGAYCFPGGGVEAGESPPEALIRELHEELGVAAVPIAQVWRSLTPWRVELFWWLAEIAADAVLSPNPAEVESSHWLSPSEILALPNLLTTNREFILGVQSGQIQIP